MTNHASLSGNPMGESGFDGCLSNCIVSSIKFGGKGIMDEELYWPAQSLDLNSIKYH